jgi:hypothetical protein
VLEVLEKEVVASNKKTAILSTSTNFNVDVISKVEKRVRAFINNSDWIYETLSAINKVLSNEYNFTRFEVWSLDKFDLEVSVENDIVSLTDRYKNRLTRKNLLDLKTKILSITVTHANKVLKKPELHHMEKTFMRVLRKSVSNQLNDEEISILNDVYLRYDHGKIVNLRGESVKLPRFGVLSIFSIFSF